MYVVHGTSVSILPAAAPQSVISYGLWIDGYRPDSITWEFSTTWTPLDVTVFDWGFRGPNGTQGDCLGLAARYAHNQNPGTAAEFDCGNGQPYMCEYELEPHWKH